uniref:Uncharacterized protein n=1 Tax=Clandestinovirus TaxID=2831644 RepID=A0A8F8KPL0_9VIRU|nr:hypothetical protein KOM_12_191 [Clandestinovirus]
MSKLTDVEVGLRASDWTAYSSQVEKFAEFLSFDIKNDWIKSVRVMYGKDRCMRIFVIFNDKMINADKDMKSEIEQAFMDCKILVDDYDWNSCHRWMITKTKSQSIRMATFLAKYLEFEESQHQQWWNKICDGQDPLTL